MHSPTPHLRAHSFRLRGLCARLQPFLALLAACIALVGLSACSGNAAPQQGGVQGLVVSADDQLDFGVDMARRQLWSEALFRFRQASEKDPSNPRIFNNLAVSAEAIGDFDQALEYYREALRLAPSDREIRGNYARFVEFYRAFQPAEEGEEGAAAEDGDAATSAEGDASREDGGG